MENITDIKIVEEKIKGMREMVIATVIKDDETLAEAADKVKIIKTMAKFIKQEMEKYTIPAKEIIAQAKGKYEPYLVECEKAEYAIKDKSKDYLIAKEAERKKQEEVIATKVEAGQIKEDTAIRRLEKLGEEQKGIKTENGGKLNLKTIKKVNIFDPNQVPDEYWVLDEVKIRKVALAGVIIPGVEVVEEKTISA